MTDAADPRDPTSGNTDRGHEPTAESQAPKGYAKVSIRYEGTKFHIEGPEDVVQRALERHLSTVSRMMQVGGGPAVSTSEPLGLVHTADASTGTHDGPTTLTDWYQSRIVHPDGRRGMVQDHVLLFTYFLTQVRGADSATTSEIRRCFEEIEMKVPNVPVMVYNLKSKGSLEPGGAYASYLLTQAGRDYIESRYSIVQRRTS